MTPPEIVRRHPPPVVLADRFNERSLCRERKRLEGPENRFRLREDGGSFVGETSTRGPQAPGVADGDLPVRSDPVEGLPKYGPERILRR